MKAVAGTRNRMCNRIVHGKSGTTVRLTDTYSLILMHIQAASVAPLTSVPSLALSNQLCFSAILAHRKGEGGGFAPTSGSTLSKAHYEHVQHFTSLCSAD